MNTGHVKRMAAALLISALLFFTFFSMATAPVLFSQFAYPAVTFFEEESGSAVENASAADSGGTLTSLGRSRARQALKAIARGNHFLLFHGADDDDPAAPSGSSDFGGFSYDLPSVKQILSADFAFLALTGMLRSAEYRESGHLLLRRITQFLHSVDGDGSTGLLVGIL